MMSLEVSVQSSDLFSSEYAMSVCFVCCVHESPVDANFLILSRRKMSLNSGKCAEMDVKTGADQIQ